MTRIRLNATLDEPTARRWLTALVQLRLAMHRLERTARKAGITTRPLATPTPARPGLRLGRFDQLDEYARQRGYARKGEHTHTKGHRP